MAAVRFPKPEVVFYLSRALRYLLKIWYANKLYTFSNRCHH